MADDDLSPAAHIDQRIRDLGDWRGDLLGRVRAVAHRVDPGIEEGWKWRGVPTWEHDGLLFTGESYKDKIKLTFHKGAALEDPAGLFNSSLDGNTRRAIDLFEDDTLDEDALGDLILGAIALNEAKPARKKK
jgi:hypothetical protein